jgi:IPT/TIG domain
MAATYTYINYIKVTGVVYAFGPIAGGQGVAIVGDGFQPGAFVTFGGVSATGEVVQNEQTIYCLTPAHAAGSVSVTVTNPDGSSDTRADAYRYQEEDPDFLSTALLSIRREDSEISIQDTLGQAKTCRITTDVEPTGEQELQISVFGKALFTGNLQYYMQRCQELPLNLVWDCDLIDYTAKLNRRRPFGVFNDISVTTVVTNLVTGYAPIFTLHIQVNLPNITIRFTGIDEFSQCLDELAQYVNGHWYVEGLDLWFFVSDPGNNNPADLTDDNLDLEREPQPSFSLDWRNIRNRIFGKGAGGLSVQVDNVASQALYGIREFKIEDTKIRTLARLTQRCNVELANYAFPIPSLHYVTRDLNTRSGKWITSALTQPPIVGTFLIQTVSISQIHEADELKPRFDVMAAPVRFQFVDFMRNTVVRHESNRTPELVGDIETDPDTGAIIIPPGTVSHEQLVGCIPDNKINPSGVVAGQYGDAGTIPQFIVGASGQVSQVAGVPIAIIPSQVAGLEEALVSVPHTLTELTDVTIIDPVDGQILEYNESTNQWENTVPTLVSVNALNDLTDVTIDTPAEGQVLAYDAETGQWENRTGGALIREDKSFVLGTIDVEHTGIVDLGWHTALVLSVRCATEISIVFYASALSRDTDPRTFPPVSDPSPGIGVLGEFLFDETVDEILVSPPICLYSANAGSTLIYYRVYNPAGTPVAVTIDMTVVGLE